MFGKFSRKSKQKSPDGADDDEDRASLISIPTAGLSRRHSLRSTRSKSEAKSTENATVADEPITEEKEQGLEEKQRSTDKPEPIETDDNEDDNSNSDDKQGEIRAHKYEDKDKENDSASSEDFSDNEEVVNWENLSSWKHSESSLISAINLQIEKERSKQEKLKLKNLQRTIDVLNMAINYKVPKDSIPLIFSNSIKLTSEDAKRKLASYNQSQSIPQVTSASSGGTSSTTGGTASTAPTSQQSRPYTHAKSQSSISSTSSNQPITSVFKVNIPQQVHYQFHHWQGPGQGTITSTSNDDTSGGPNIKRPRKLSDALLNEQSFSSLSGNTTLMSPRGVYGTKGHVSQLPSLSSLNAPITTSSPKSPLRRSLGHRRNLSETAAAASVSKYQPYNKQFIPGTFNTPPRPAHPLSVSMRSPQPQQQQRPPPPGLEGSFQGNFVFPTYPQQLPSIQQLQLQLPGPSPSAAAASRQQQHQRQQHHHRSRSKADVNFMISPPDNPNDKKK